MTRLRPLSYRKVERALLALGFERLHQRGSHVHFRHTDGRRTVVPCHSREDIRPGLVRAIVRDIGIPVEDFFALT